MNSIYSWFLWAVLQIPTTIAVFDVFVKEYPLAAFSITIVTSTLYVLLINRIER